MFVLHRKQTYGPPRSVTGIYFLSYLWMLIVPHRKHIYGPPWPVTEIVLLCSAITHQETLWENMQEFRSGYLFLGRMASSGMLRRVALVRTHVSEELSSSFIKVTRIGALRTKTLALTSKRNKLRRIITCIYDILLLYHISSHPASVVSYY
jgi:hypothetical protein